MAVTRRAHDRGTSVTEQTGRPDIDYVRADFNRARAADQVERPANQEDDRHRKRPRFRPTRQTLLKPVQPADQLSAATVHCGAFLQAVDGFHGLREITVADYGLARRQLPRPSYKRQRSAPTESGIAIQFSLAKVLPDRRRIHLDHFAQDLAMNRPPSIRRTDLHVGDLQESPATPPVDQTLQMSCVGHNIVMQRVSANRLPPLLRVDKPAERGIFQPQGGLVQDARQSIPVEQLGRIAVVNARHGPTVRHPRLHVRQVPGEVLTKRKHRRIKGVPGGEIEPHDLPTSDARRALPLTPPLARQVDPERYVDTGYAACRVGHRRIQSIDAGVLGN